MARLSLTFISIGSERNFDTALRPIIERTIGYLEWFSTDIHASGRQQGSGYNQLDRCDYEVTNMRALARGSLIAHLIGVTLVAYVTGAMPVKFVPAVDTFNHPGTVSNNLTPTEPRDINSAKIARVIAKVRLLSEEKRAEVQAELEKLNKPPKPKTGLTKLFDRILQFFRRERSPVAAVWDRAWAVGGASLGPVKKGYAIGSWTTRLLRVFLRATNLFQVPS
ncbi:hypothetical protein PSTG_16388 [Puccinia striiformis f. sp. tritici PST-78]|uniref:Uncharacterized protein n=2 Tax=Puccinia striiformis f. sp. tritici TaxID=168172 RepID=A0A0L0UT20_9BASI|nr:hypothetical protein PSTG_16388 [Puccinia striiformis f. sp. tritici PST-78]